MSHFNRLLTIAILSVSSPVAYGISIPYCNPHEGTRTNVNDLHRIAIMGDDGRMTFSEYAEKHRATGLTLKAVHKKYSATGTFSCNGFSATGQLTGANDLVTTAAHVFFDKQCNLKIDPATCYFQPVGAREKLNVKFESLQHGCAPGSRRGDWAVIKLERPAAGSNFYQVPSADAVLATDLAITQVSANDDNFQRGGTYPANIQNCNVRELSPYVVFKHDCDTGGASSGSAQLIESANGPMIISLNVSQSKPIHPDGTLYGPSHYNLGIPVAGEFLKAINKALGR